MVVGIHLIRLSRGLESDEVWQRVQIGKCCYIRIGEVTLRSLHKLRECVVLDASGQSIVLQVVLSLVRKEYHIAYYLHCECGRHSRIRKYAA